MTNIPALSQKIERLKAQKTRLAYLEKKQVNRKRKAPTRTLIQEGALLNLLGYFDLCGIKEGDDLQLDVKYMDQAAILIGILEFFKETVSPNLSRDEMEYFKTIGVRVLKMNAKNKTKYK